MDDKRLEGFVAIGLSDKAAREVLNNAALSAALDRAIQVAGPSRAQGKRLLHEFAVASVNGSFGPHADAVLTLVVEDKIASSKQLKAAAKHLGALQGRPLDAAALAQAAGVGVVVTEAELRTSVARVLSGDAVAAKRWAALGLVMKEVSALHEFADGNAVRDLVAAEMTARFGPQPDEKKDKKAAAEVQKAAAAAEVVVERPATPFEPVRVHEAAKHIGRRVRVQGWVHEVRVQSKLVFLVVRDAGSGFIQVLLAGDLAKLRSVQELKKESSVHVFGVVAAVPEGQKAENGIEIQADFIDVVGPAMGDIDQAVNKDCSDDIKADQRHLLLRGRRMAAYLRLRSLAMHCMRSHFMERRYYEVTPPTLVQTSCEGGSDLFSFDFFGEPAYLTQSSQLYLETVCPSVGKTFCILPSFRAEKSRTRRHLAEYTHLEAELPWISFEDLMNAMEELIVDTVARIQATPEAKQLLDFINPDFVPPKRPFRRMSYTEAVKYCQDHNITKNDDTGKPTGVHYQFGDDLPEAAERAILADINEPIFMNKFPVPLK